MAKTTAKGPNPKSEGKATSAQESLGFPAMEKLLDQSNPDLSGFRLRAEELKHLIKSAAKAESKAAARQAELAYQRFFELFEELLEIRENLATQQKKEAEKKPSKKK